MQLLGLRDLWIWAPLAIDHHCPSPMDSFLDIQKRCQVVPQVGIGRRVIKQAIITPLHLLPLQQVFPHHITPNLLSNIQSPIIQLAMNMLAATGLLLQRQIRHRLLECQWPMSVRPPPERLIPT